MHGHTLLLRYIRDGKRRDFFAGQKLYKNAMKFGALLFFIALLPDFIFCTARGRSSARIFDGHALLVRAKYQVCGAGAQREHSVQTYDKCTSYLPIGIIYKY